MTSTSFVLIVIISFVLALIILPLFTSLALWLFSNVLKFQKKDYRTALYSSLTIFGIGILIESALAMLFFNELQNFSWVVGDIALIISFVAGVYIVRRFYKESVLKSFLALLLGGVVVLIVAILIAIIISLLMFSH
jgi:hypothetical protein